MTYEYVLTMDQHKYEYGRNEYRSMNISTTVRADTFDEALEEAQRILPEPRTGYTWASFLKSVTFIPEPPSYASDATVLGEPVGPLTKQAARRLPRYRGV